MTIIQSVSYRDRSLSRERTHMDLEDPNGVSEGDIGLPTPLTEFQRWYYWFGKFLWLDMSLKSLDSRGHAVPWVGSVCPEITTSRHSHQDFILEFLFRIFSKIHLTGSFTRTPKYSCRDCWTGVNPMKNDQSKPDTKPLWGLKSKPLTNKPKEERILDTVNRVISRIQNDERNCLWPNTSTRPAWGCRWPSRKTWPPSVTDIELMNQTSWDVPSWSSSLTSNRIPIRPHVICFSEVTLGHPSDMTPIQTSQSPCWGVFCVGVNPATS